MVPVEAIVFDCFGVIVVDALSVMVREFAAAGGHEDELRQIRDLLHLANSGLAAADVASAQIASILGMSHAEYHQLLQQNETKDQLLLDYILGLRGSYKTALLSNIPKDSLGRRFSNDELARYFDVVVASGEIGFAKPHTKAYQITAERLGVPAGRCVFTDDRLPYCNGAAEAGMRTILYSDFPQFRAELQALLSPPVA